MPRVAVIGMGEMGAGVARRLVDHGVRVLTPLDGRSAATRLRALSAGAEPVELRELLSAEMLLSIVPPDAAEAVLAEILPTFAAAKTAPPYLDCNPLAPDTKRAMAARLRAVGCDMVDVGIIGVAPVAGSAGPLFCASGERRQLAAPLGEWGFRVRLLDGPVGTAAAVKLAHAGISKGLTALACGVLLAAIEEGEIAAAAAAAEVRGTMPEIHARLQRTVPDMYPKAARWSGEMREIAAWLGTHSAAAAKVFEGLAEFYDERADPAAAPTERSALAALLGR